MDRGGRVAYPCATPSSAMTTSPAIGGPALATRCGVGGASELDVVTENVAEERSVEAPSMVKNVRPSLFGAVILMV